MAPKKKPPTEILDPTLPFTEIVIGDRTYKMCLTHDALCYAEDDLVQKGHNVNLLRFYGAFTASNTRSLFAMSLRKFHPEIPFEEALALVTPQNARAVASKVSVLWDISTPEASADASENPPQEI